MENFDYTELSPPDYYMLNVVIANYGKGSKVLAFAKACGIGGGTIIIGKGTVRGSFLKFLELDRLEKEVVLLVSNKGKSDSFMQAAAEHFDFQKPNKGICFSMPLSGLVGTRQCKTVLEYEGDDSVGLKYNMISIIVDRGQSEDVVDAANAAGARGATIFHARGSGIHETSKVFAIAIEPEKEMVIIVAEDQKADKICQAIDKAARISEPGHGIMFVQKLDKVYGLSQDVKNTQKG